MLPAPYRGPIHDHSHNLDRAGYRYVSDIITPSLALLAEMCPIRSIDIDAPKLDTYKVMRCFEWPVKVDSVDHTTQRIITKIHPLVAMSKLLAAYPKQITAFRFGLSHTVYLSPSIVNICQMWKRHLRRGSISVFAVKVK